MTVQDPYTLTAEQVMQIERERMQVQREETQARFGDYPPQRAALDAAVATAGPLAYTSPRDLVEAARIFEAYLREGEAIS